MSRFQDMINECCNIKACLPQVEMLQVMPILSKYANEEQDQRIKLTLQELFIEQDKQDNLDAKQNDMELIQRLLPDITKRTVLSLMSYVGNVHNRKALVLRFLLKGYRIIRVKSTKHKLDEVSVETDDSKKLKLSNDSSLTTLEDDNVQNNNFNNSTLAETSSTSAKDNIEDKCSDMVSVEVSNENVTNVKDIISTPRIVNVFTECTDDNIYQPSTSRAVWNPFTGNYEDDIHTTGLIPTEENTVPSLEYLEETQEISYEDLGEKFSNTPKEIVTVPVIGDSENATRVENLDSAENGSVDISKNEEKPKKFTWMDVIKECKIAEESVPITPKNGLVSNNEEQPKKVPWVDVIPYFNPKKLEDYSSNTENYGKVVSVVDSNQQETKEQNQVPGAPGEDVKEYVQKDSVMASTSALASPMAAMSVENKLLYPLMEMFPQACPNHLRNLCANKKFSEDILNELTTKLLSADYPLRQERPPSPEKLDPDEQFEILKQVLPDADPTYLRFQCDQFSDNPEGLRNFISEAIETKKYPTMKEYLRKEQLSAQQKQYTVDFQVAKFLEIIPDPVVYFEDPKRQANIPAGDMHFVCAFLKNEFPLVSVTTIRNAASNGKSVLGICKDLNSMIKSKKIPLLKVKRKVVPLPNNCQNIPLLQEMAYISHRKEIAEFIRQQKFRDMEERQKAKKLGLLLTCNCCFDDQILQKDIVTCENGCTFCKQCVEKSVEVAFGNAKLDFLCLRDCKSHFSLQTLQNAVSPKLFSKVAQKKQLEEVKAAGIEDLEMCPFCDFATIPAEADKIFRCLNPECMKESCRQCKEPSHIPLKCDEVEKDEDVKRRTYLENKMSEALLKKCYKCGKRYIKSDGCNKITCTCGAMQCYVCGEPVSGYQHFNGQGGDKYHLCPLYSDTETLHEQAVLKGVEAAKAEIGINPNQLKFDPTQDIKNYYSQLKKKAPPLPPGMVIHPPRAVQHPVGNVVNNRHNHHVHAVHHHHHNHHRNYNAAQHQLNNVDPDAAHANLRQNRR